MQSRRMSDGVNACQIQFYIYNRRNIDSMNTRGGDVHKGKRWRHNVYRPIEPAPVDGRLSRRSPAAGSTKGACAARPRADAIQLADRIYEDVM